MKLKIWFTPCLLAVASLALAQSRPLDLALEIQAYPTGLMGAFDLETAFSKKSAFVMRAGYNLVRHRDLGKHDDERGGGFGGSVGYKHYFSNGYKGFFSCFRTDIWFNKIDWKNNPGEVAETSGTSRVTVVQPTEQLGWTFLLGEKWTLMPTLALGVEVNVKTKGEPTGEGLILLAGLQAGRRF